MKQSLNSRKRMKSAPSFEYKLWQQALRIYCTLVIIKVKPISIPAYIHSLAWVKCFCRPCSVDPVPIRASVYLPFTIYSQCESI